MNLMAQIAKALEIDIGEEFKVITPANVEKKCRFFERGNEEVYLEKYNPIYGQWTQENTDEIGRIVVGNYKVEKLPYKPERGQMYWSVYWQDGAILPHVARTTFDGTGIDYARKYCGNCFRTEEEAEREKYSVYEKLTGKEWDRE